jgi:hypothetical protein
VTSKRAIHDRFPWKLVRHRSCYCVGDESDDAEPGDVLTTSKLSTLERKLREALGVDADGVGSGLDQRKSRLLGCRDVNIRVDVYHHGAFAHEVHVAPHVSCALSGGPAVALVELPEAAVEGATAIEVHLDWTSLEGALGPLPEPVLRHGEMCFIEPQDLVSEQAIDAWMDRAEDPETIEGLVSSPPGFLLYYGTLSSHLSGSLSLELDPGSPDD